MVSKCQKCSFEGMTRVKRECTLWTFFKWIGIFMCFCCCILCICLYTPTQRGGAITEYLECKCLHRSIVHYCKQCGKRIMVVHPEFRPKGGLVDSDSDDDESRYT